MKQIIKFNRILPIALGLFLVSNMTLANHHEETEADAIDIEKIEQHRAIHKKERALKRDRKRHHRAMGIHDRLDTNEDGKVDLNEFLSHAESRFNEMDADSDQFVTEEEARQYHKDMRKKHGKMRKEHRQKRRAKDDADADS